ncbi:serine/threonine-protein kinase STY8-like, partial [Phalaenopsis equestris]|uniref:serine/threonine-protein kinase STY8-like n=1 Tax=Phalaenopsis equestris TaxID=78828 RepID=UPI0009E23F61
LQSPAINFPHLIVVVTRLSRNCVNALVGFLGAIQTLHIELLASGCVVGNRLMAINDAESCESRALPEKPLQYQRQNSKFGVYKEVLRRLMESGSPEVLAPSFKEELWSHFNRLPARYALDVNVERAEDVLTHKRLLQQAQDPVLQLAFDIRLVQMPRGESFGTNSQSEEDT